MLSSAISTVSLFTFQILIVMPLARKFQFDFAPGAYSRRGECKREMAAKGDKGLTTKPSLPAEDSTSTRARYLEMYALGLTECPTSDAEVQALVSEYNLKHGDVVNFNDYRDTDSHIVFRQKDGKLTLLANPDDRGSGYLTIPKV